MGHTIILVLVKPAYITPKLSEDPSRVMSIRERCPHFYGIGVKPFQKTPVRKAASRSGNKVGDLFRVVSTITKPSATPTHTPLTRPMHLVLVLGYAGHLSTEQICSSRSFIDFDAQGSSNSAARMNEFAASAGGAERRVAHDLQAYRFSLQPTTRTDRSLELRWILLATTIYTLTSFHQEDIPWLMSWRCPRLYPRPMPRGTAIESHRGSPFGGQSAHEPE